MVITPAVDTPVSTTSYRTGRGTVEFFKSAWDQLPTMHHIVNALAALPILEVGPATVVKTIGMSDLREQRLLGPVIGKNTADHRT
jgi:hypothetical protein